MKQYLYRIQPVRPAMLTDGGTEAEQRATGEHFAYLQTLTEAGTVILAGRTTNTDYSSFGIVILQAEDDEAATKIVENDPAVQQKVMRAELFPYRIALLNAENAS